jgi:hypothetical protein
MKPRKTTKDKGRTGQDEGMIPRKLVAAAVKAEEEENERCDQESSTQEINSFQPRFVVLFDGDLDEEEDK